MPDSEPIRSAIRFAVDIGGTFTDLQLVDEATGVEISLSSEISPEIREFERTSLNAGFDAFRSRPYGLAGGGGHGDPAARDPAALAADLAGGYVTLDHAQRSTSSGD